MKKIVKIITPIAAVLAAALLFTTCKQFLADPEEFLSYWAAEVVPESFSFNPASKKSKDGTECITSASDVTLTLNLRNPKSFSLVMPTSSANAGSVINFPGLNQQPVLGTDYTLQQTSGSRLKLLYKKNFLEKHERKDSNIGVEITLTGEDGRKFSERFSLGLNVNTAPSLEYKTIRKTQDNGKWYYVLILQAQNMNSTMGSGHVHDDIEKLRITKEDGTADDYEIDGINFSTKKFKWKPGSPLLDGAVPLAAGDYEDTPPQLPTDGWLIYYKTDVEVKDAAKSYTFSLIDSEGVSSDPETVSTAKVKAKNVKLYTMTDSEITNATQDNPGAIAAGLNDANVTLKAKTETAGAKITGTVEKKDGGLWTRVKDINSSTNEVAIELTAPEPDKEILYSIAVTAGGDGFVSSAEKNFYFKVTKTATLTVDANKPNAWGKLKTAAENPTGPAEIIIDGEIKATNAAGNFGEIKISRDITIKGKTGADTDILNANRGGTSAPAQEHRIFKVASGKTLTLENLTLKGGYAPVSGAGGGAICAEGALTMKKCKVTENIAKHGNGGGIYAGGALTMTECKVTSNTVDSDALGGGGIYIHTIAPPTPTSVRTMENCTVSYNTAIKGNGGGIYTADKLTITGGSLENNTVGNTSGGNGGGIYVEGSTLTVKNNCSITGNKAISSGNGGGISVAGNTTHNGVLNLFKCTLTGNKTEHGSGGGISVVKSHLTMENCTLTDNDGENNGNGGGVYVGDSGTFTIKDKSCITPSAAYDKGKNDVFLAGSSKITIDDVLDPDGGIAARITPSTYGDGVKVLDETTPGLLNSEHGKFTVTPGGIPQKEWEVDNDGKLKMKQGGGSSGATIDAESETNPNTLWKKLKDAVKNAQAGNVITIRGTINATKYGTGEHKNFGEIIIDKNITIEGTTNQTSDILNANKTEDGKTAHRIFVVKNGAKLTLKGLTLKGGIAPSGAGGGGIFIEDGGTVELENCTIEDCETGSGSDGGAISISGTANLTGCTIKTCTAKRNGGGVYVGKNGTFTMNNCTLTGNKANANGGGVYVGSNAKKFTMKGSSCITPSTAPDKGKNDVFLTVDKKINLIDTLTGASPVARITVGTAQYNTNTKVLDGDITKGAPPNQNYTKFTVTPKSGGGWKVDHTGHLYEG